MIMKQEDKNLLIKDLCGRLPYKTKINVIIDDSMPDIYGNFDDNLTSIDKNLEMINCENDIESVKPYLFPMSSMTDEQKKEFDSLTNPNSITESLQECLGCIDWLNKNHFDYRGLIKRGLAIDCTNLNIY